jgi:hypothetical protein
VTRSSLTSASKIRLPGNSQRTNTQAVSNPRTALTVAAINEAPMVNR